MTERKNPGRGECCVCGDEFNLTSNGRIRSHGPRDARCTGGSDLPAGTAPTNADASEAEPDAGEDAASPTDSPGPNPHRAPLTVEEMRPVRVAGSILRSDPEGSAVGSVVTAQPTEPAFVVIPDPVQFTTAVPVSQTPTVRGGDSVRPGPEKTDFDQWGRYRIPDPATGALAGRQRVTTFVKMISDQWGLSQWQQRKLLIGAAENPAVTSSAAGKDAKTDKAFLDGLGDVLKDAAGSKEAAALGTAIHSLTERYDMGTLVFGEIEDDRQRADVRAYADAISDAGLTVIREMVERTTMVRSLDVTGTLDRILRLPNGDYVIGDVKTGKDLSYGWLDIGMQLACYAYGVNENGVFDWSSRQWIEAPKVRTDFAIVMHMPAGQGTCTLYRVDLNQGWANCALARSVRYARKVRNHAVLLDMDSIPSAMEDLREPAADHFRAAAELTEVPVPLTVQPHSESFAQPEWDGGRFARNMLDTMAAVKSRAEAASLYAGAVASGAPAALLRDLGNIGSAALEARQKARTAMAAVASQPAAAELYGYAMEVWPDDAEFLEELAGIGNDALIPY